MPDSPAAIGRGVKDTKKSSPSNTLAIACFGLLDVDDSVKQMTKGRINHRLSGQWTTKWIPRVLHRV